MPSEPKPPERRRTCPLPAGEARTRGIKASLTEAEHTEVLRWSRSRALEPGVVCRIALLTYVRTNGERA